MGRSVVERARGRPRCGSTRGVRGSGRSDVRGAPRAAAAGTAVAGVVAGVVAPADTRRRRRGQTRGWDGDANATQDARYVRGEGLGRRVRGGRGGFDGDGPRPSPRIEGGFRIVGGPQPQPRPRIRPQHVRGYLARRAFRRTRRGRARTPRPGCLPHARVPPRVFPRRASVTRGGVPRVRAFRVLARAGGDGRGGRGGGDAKGVASPRVGVPPLLRLVVRRRAGEMGAVGVRATRHVPRGFLRRHERAARRRSPTFHASDASHRAERTGRPGVPRLLAFPGRTRRVGVDRAGVSVRASTGDRDGVRGARSRTRAAPSRGTRVRRGKPAASASWGRGGGARIRDRGWNRRNSGAARVGTVRFFRRWSRGGRGRARRRGGRRRTRLGRARWR